MKNSKTRQMRKNNKDCPPGSENLFIQVRNRKHHRRGGTAVPREPKYQARQVQNESILSTNTYNYLNNITSRS
jgi:hypothetical protein